MYQAPEHSVVGSNMRPCAYVKTGRMGQMASCSPYNEAEDIKGQIEYGKGSKGDEE